MTYEGYLNFGGNEIVNTERARGYATTASCYIPWIRSKECLTLRDALGHEPYTYSNISFAPWFDPGKPGLTGRFLGVVGLRIDGVDDSTRSATVTEGIDDGGVMGRMRKGARSIRITATLIADGDDALDYGIAWLSAALDPGACGQHGTACGTTDLEFFSACPPAREPGEAQADYDERVDDLRRFMHGVAATSGPLRVQYLKSQDSSARGATMEWTITSERPWIYTKTRPVELPTTSSTVINDTPFNLVPYPSAELAGSAVVVATNYVANPSFETQVDTGWSGAFDLYSGTAEGIVQAGGLGGPPLVAAGVVSMSAFVVQQDLGRVGEWGHRHWYEVTLPSLPAGTRYSASIWGYFVQASGSASALTSTSAFGSLVWLNNANTVLRTDSMGSVSPAPQGHAFDIKSVLPPVGATKARVSVGFRYAFNTATSTFRVDMYYDACALTVP